MLGDSLPVTLFGLPVVVIRQGEPELTHSDTECVRVVARTAEHLHQGVLVAVRTECDFHEHLLDRLISRLSACLSK